MDDDLLENKMRYLQITPEILRQTNPRVLETPKDAPIWLTPQYIAQSMENPPVQASWNPKVGDWYFCTDLMKVGRIDSLFKYYSYGEGIFGFLTGMLGLRNDWPIGSIAKGRCDVYLPAPKGKGLEGKLEEDIEQE